MSDFSGQVFPLGTEVSGQTEVADTAIEISTLPGIRSLSYQTQVLQRLTNQFILVNSFAVKFDS